MSSKETFITMKELSSQMEGATSADKIKPHLVGVTSEDKLKSRLPEISAAEQMEINGCYSTEDQIKSRMAELSSFMTNTVKSFENLNPDEYIAVFKRMENKYKSKSFVESVHLETKLGILVGVFEKYLQCRLPKAPIEDECGAIKIIVEAMVSASCDRVEDFTINDVWKLMKTAYSIRLDPRKVMENDMTWHGSIFTLEMFITQIFRKISYFGEFLYFCAAFASFKDSPLAKMIDMCDLKDLEVVEEIRRNVTPELGISTFIIYRNWISDSFPNTRENMEFWITIIQGEQGFGYFHDAYRKSLETIEKSELLHDYFKRFLIFLGSEASSAHRYFDLDVLSSKGFLNGLRSKKGIMLLTGIHKYLLKITQFFVDVLLYLYDTEEDTICFKEIPKFFNSYWNRSNCSWEFVPTYIYDATQLMDFVFIDQFHNNFTRAYYDICVGISDLAIDRFELPHTREPIITKYCLFPFFDVQNAE